MAAVYTRYIPIWTTVPLQAKLIIIVPNFNTINIFFNIYLFLNIYKSYIVATLSVRSTAVSAVTAEQSNRDLDGGGYRNIPVKVEVFVLPRKIVLWHTNNLLPTNPPPKKTIPHYP